MKVLAIVAALAGVAHAEGKPDAEKLFRAGESAYKAQNFEGAAMNFEQAYKAYPLPEIAFSAAQAYRRQYRVDPKPQYVQRAIELYRAYLDRVKTGGRVADAADALADMQRELDHLIKSGQKVAPEVAAEHTQFGVNVQLADATTAGGMRAIEDTPTETQPQITLTIDGKPIAPFTPMNVLPGKHAVHAEAPGYIAQDREDTVAPGAYRMLDVTLAPRPAHLVIETDARVVVDGRVAGDAPVAIDVAAGKHLIAILHDGREPWAQDLELHRGQQLALSPALEVTAKRRWAKRTAIATGVTGALAVAALTVALIEDSRASSIHDKLVSPGDQPPSAGVDYNNALRWRDRAIDALWAFGALTVVAGATTAVLYYTDKPSLAVTGHF